MRLSPAVQTLKPSATIAAAAKAKQLKQSGVKVYDFTLGEPDFNTPEHIQQAAIEAMRAGHTHYTPSGGILELKQAIGRAYERDYGLKVAPNQIVVSNGAKHCIHNVLTALCGPGDEVIIPTPYWVSYSALVELTGAVPVLIETTAESGFCLTAAQLEAAITPRTRLLMLNSPSNPTGSVYPPARLEELAQVCVARGLMILSDEIYEKLLYGDAEFRCVATFSPEIAARTIIVSGVSKAYAMTGWRIGWSIAPVELTQAIDNLQSQETSNPCSVSQYAAIAALDGPQQCVSDMLAEFTRRREYVVQRFRDLPDLGFVEPTGAFYMFFDASRHFDRPLQGGRRVSNASDFCTALLEEAHVALVTGDAFGAPGYARLSFASAMPQLEAGIDRLAAFLKG
ncbi:MAG: pyridoxal phosphate-dependent aminotransferase [Planctomyces sp.]|nr:pyridoxal phosphate-dependent aminotransferase [Planctomyces sp.]